MTETEELRGGLREFGVQYQACGDSFTMWKHDGKTATYAEYPEGGKLKAFVTPEQAIAATLGAGTCQLKRAQWDDGTCTWGCICTACDAHLEHETGIGYSYCPHCGRKVVDE